MKEKGAMLVFIAKNVGSIYNEAFNIFQDIFTEIFTENESKIIKIMFRQV